MTSQRHYVRRHRDAFSLRKNGYNLKRLQCQLKKSDDAKRKKRNGVVVPTCHDKRETSLPKSWALATMDSSLVLTNQPRCCSNALTHAPLDFPSFFLFCSLKKENPSGVLPRTTVFSLEANASSIHHGAIFRRNRLYELNN